MNELQARLKTLKSRIKGLALKADLSDNEQAELAELVEDAEHIQAQIKALKLADEPDDAAEIEAEDNEDIATLKARIAVLEGEDAKSNRLPFDGNSVPKMTEFHDMRKFDHLNGGQTALAVELYKAAGFDVPEAAYQAAAVKALEDTDRAFEPPDKLGKPGDERLMLKAMGIDGKDKAARFKANEAMYSTSSGFGDDWVTVQYSNQLWPSIRQGNPVLELADRFSVIVPQGAESITFPLEAGDPTWYVAAQDVDTGNNGPAATVTSSRVATTNKSLTVNKLGARVPFTGELEEDSIIPIVPQIERQIVLSGADYLTSVLIDGDTEASASTNINDIAGTPAATDWFMHSNGYRKLALVTTTANSRSAGTLSADDYLETLYLMGVGGKNAFGAMDNVFFIQDPGVNKMALQLPEVKTRDVFANPTVENGLLTGLWGYRIITSFNMHRASLVNAAYEYKTNASGKIDVDTGSNNTKGALLAVRADQWRVGYKRRIKLNSTYFAASDLTEIVAMMRVGHVNRDGEASAISYNITV